MENPASAVQMLIHGANTLFILMGAVMVLAMHAGFAFLEVGTVRLKNQVNALSKIIADFAVSTLAYFFIGYWVAYGVTFLQPADHLIADNGYSLVNSFSCSPSLPRYPRSSQAESPSVPDSGRNCARPC